MNLKEFYLTIGGNYEEVMSRLRMEKLILKFVLKFLNDDSFENLNTALKQQDLETAFRASHTLKGVSQNLGFTQLFYVSEELTQALRPLTPLTDDTLFKNVALEYEKTISAIKKLS